MARGIPGSKTDSNDLNTTQKSHIDMPADGMIDRSALREDGIDVAPAAGLSDYARELEFMEELVEVEVHESTDPNAEPIIDLYCNGVPQRLIRGVPHAVKRKFVQILANARQTSMTTTTKVDGDNVVNRINKHSALRYPFRVVRDDNPRGRDWLRNTLQAA